MQEFGLLPGKSHRVYFIPPTRSGDGTYEILLRKNLVLASLAILAQGMPEVYQTWRFLEGKWTFSIKAVICAHSRMTTLGSSYHSRYFLNCQVPELHRVRLDKESSQETVVSQGLMHSVFCKLHFNFFHCMKE